MGFNRNIGERCLKVGRMVQLGDGVRFVSVLFKEIRCVSYVGRMKDKCTLITSSQNQKAAAIWI
jgi:hypothetical protein